MEQWEDMAAGLTDDVLADVLRRLAPRSLAASRCVCKAWRAIIDARRLLRADLLPHSVGGVFIDFHGLHRPEFFSRPSTGPTISGKFDYLPDQDQLNLVRDHCNGLLLLEDYVVNPATRWYATLPPRSSPRMGISSSDVEYLVFDPAVSPHYEVFSIPRFHHKRKRYRRHDKSEWPPTPCILHVFSSRTRRWEETSYVRRGEAAATVADVRSEYWPIYHRHGVYWRGALYVHCQANFVMRISLSDDKYQVIEPPMGIGVDDDYGLHLGRSEKGVYCALVDGWFGLRVWILHESCDQMQWVLKHQNDLERMLSLRNYDRQVCGPWILQDINYYGEYNEDDNVKEPVEEKFEWSSDNDNVLDNEDVAEERYYGYIVILGFHPFKEVVFLGESLRRGLAYHLNSSKIQDLGNIYPTCYDQELPNERLINASFPYTPCWM